MEPDLQQRYTRALNAFIDKVKQDKYVLAVILAGSLYHDVVWEKSDIDVILVVDDAKNPTNHFSLVAEGVIINATAFDRRKFKRQMDTALRSGWFHSWLSKTALVYTTDETLRELYESMLDIGEHDKAMLLAGHGAYALGDLAKAQKWLLVKGDHMYSYYSLMRSLNNLAAIEVILGDAIPGREVIKQALELNPAFFHALYIDLAQREKNAAAMEQALQQVERYLQERATRLFSAVLDALSQAGTTLCLTELFERLPLLPDVPLVDACEWLAELGIIEKLSAPIELTHRSRAFVDEVAYYYDGGKGR
jgi:tetratricopeptide (TPR) repeat protein